MRWNYRGIDKRTPIAGFGTDGYLYYGSRTVTDLSITYRISRRFGVVGTWNNVFSKHIPWFRYGSETPQYASQWQVQDFGSMISLGIEGRY